MVSHPNKKQTLSMFENGMLRTLFCHKTEEVTGG